MKGMNVEKTRLRINNPASLNVQQRKVPNFTSASNALNMAEEIKPFMPSAVKGMKKVSDNIGEVQNIFINALGTGLVAPIFIKWNPLSKTDEDTRTYSAWRQPVSAVLAVVTQAGITIPYNRMVDKRANNGFYDTKYNKSLFQDKEYIEKIVKREYPYASKKVIEMIVAERQSEQKSNLLRMIRDNKVIMHSDDGKPLPLNETEYTKLLNKVLDDKLKYEKGELDKCENITINRKITRGEYYRAHREEATKIFTDLNNQLEKTSDAKALRKTVKELKKTHQSGDKELIAIFNDILDRRGNTEAELKISIQDKLKGILRDIEFYKECNSKADVENLVRTTETNVRINPIKAAIAGLEECKNRVNQKQNVGAIESYLSTIVSDKTDHRLFKFKFSEEVAKALQNQVKNNLKAHKQIGGLIVSFLTLPVSCTMLNWCYPRFMDAVFPNLSNKKHPKEIENLVNKANEQTEVKS